GALGRVTAGQDRAAGPILPLCPSCRLAGIAGRLSGHRAAVDDMQVGLRQGADHAVPGRREAARQALDLGLVQLAAQAAKVDPHGGNSMRAARVPPSGPRYANAGSSTSSLLQSPARE